MRSGSSPRSSPSTVINPPINRATVKTVENNTTIDSATTDSNGEFTLNGTEESKVKHLGVKPRGTQPPNIIDNSTLSNIKTTNVSIKGGYSTGGLVGTAKTSELTGSNAETNMSNFDFNSTWTTTNNYPELQD